MLDIQGQPPTAAQPAVPAPAAPQQNTAPKATASALIPSVSGGTATLAQWTFGFIVLLFVLAGTYLSFQLAQTNSLISARDREVKDLKTQLGQPDRVKAESIANQLKQSVSVLQTALNATSPWSSFLKEFTVRVPNAVVITNLSTSNGLEFRINGTAKSFEELAQFIKALQSSSFFKDIALESGSLSQSTEGSSVTFSAKGTFVPATAKTATSTAQGANGAQ